LRALGATELVDRETVPVSQAAREVDVVVDLVGGSDTAPALHSLRRGGVMLAVADGAADEAKAEARQLGVRIVEPLVEPDGRSLDSFKEMVADGSVRVAVDSVLPLAQAADAHRRLEAGGVRGKLVLSVR
jgi:NADPH:quinone reductase-like Zn-dependent oxidoreductase